MSRASELMDSRKFMAAMDKLGKVWFEMGEPGENSVGSNCSDEQRAEALQAVLDMAIGGVTHFHGIPLEEPATAREYELLKKGLVVEKPRGIKALIPVPDGGVTELVTAPKGWKPTGDPTKAYPGGPSAGPTAYNKPKRKRRTKAEMEAAKGTRQEEITKRLMPFNMDKATDEQVAAHIDSLAARQITPEKAIADVIESAIKPHFATRAPGPDGFKHFVVFMSRPDGSNLSSNGTKWKDALNAAGCRATKVEMTLLNAGSRQFDLMVM